MKTIKNLNKEVSLNIKRKLSGVLTILLIVLGVNNSHAQIEKLAGPRVGFTLITPGSTADILNKGIGYDEKFGKTGSSITTQFGWQWESRFGNGDGGFVGLVEWIALVGGLEKGMFLPSFSIIVGARTKEGWEFGMGPNVSLSGIGLVFGAGKNFKFNNLNVPINLAFIPGVKKEGTLFHLNSTETYTYNTGSRISILIGFNMIKNKREKRVK